MSCIIYKGFLLISTYELHHQVKDRSVVEEDGQEVVSDRIQRATSCFPLS